MHVEWALLDDEALDGFVSGDAEVDDYLKGRRWFDHARGRSKPPTYRFSLQPSGPLVGYATAAFRRLPAPGSGERALFLIVYVVGVAEAWQGVRDPATPERTLAASMFAFLEGQARAQAGCAGLYLRVREDNARAVSFYRKLGFTAGGRLPAGEGRSALVEMWRRW